MNKRYDAVGIGSPLLDLIVSVDDAFLQETGLSKGTMRVIDKDESVNLLHTIAGRELVVAPGGSAANTIAGVSQLGGRSSFIGKIGIDQHGDMYEQFTRASGVTPRLRSHADHATGHAITFITPDGERTFATHLGASQALQTHDIDEADIAAGTFLHLEGYQLAGADSLATVTHAMELAKTHGTRISIDLSDAGLIAGNLELVKMILDEYIDMVFVNEVEAEALTGKQAEEALDIIAGLCEVAVVKVGSAGSFLRIADITHAIPVYDAQVVNTNGAGDMYAGGVIYGLTHGMDHRRAGHIGSFAASRVVSQHEARLNPDSQALVREFISTING